MPHLQSQAGLADTAGTNERDEAIVRDQFGNGFLLFFTPYKGTQLKWQVMARRRLFCWLLYLCRLELAFTDLFIEVTRFRLRVNAQLLAEDFFASLILL